MSEDTVNEGPTAIASSDAMTSTIPPEWGQALWDEIADGFGQKCLPCGATGTQMGGWFNKEIETANDLKGLKMREFQDTVLT